MGVVGDAEAGLRAIRNGATILQLRPPSMSARRLEDEVRMLIATSGVPVLVSARCDIAIACGAAGVNLPELDVPVKDARRLLGDRIVGRSVHSIEAALKAAAQGADFVIFGPVWPSASHAGEAPRGVDALSAVVRAVRIPVLAIGGMTRERVNECLTAGAAGYAAIRMFA